MKPKLVSACLLGIKCRYDGKSNQCEKVIELSKKEILIPICPEQLGGLATPRERSNQIREKIVSESGGDVTKNFERGAKEVLKLANLFGIKEAILKQESPSCGCGQIRDGTFSGKTIEGDGVTTILLKKNGIKVINEEDLK